MCVLVVFLLRLLTGECCLHAHGQVRFAREVGAWAVAGNHELVSAALHACSQQQPHAPILAR